VIYYFDYSLSRYGVKPGEEITVEFILGGNTADNIYIVKPVLNKGEAYVYNSPNDTWIGQNQAWSSMPAFEGKMKLKFSLPAGEKFELYFRLQDVKTGTIYETPTQNLWQIARQEENYLINLNENVLKGYVEEIEVPHTIISEPLDKSHNYTYLSVFLAVAIMLMWICIINMFRANGKISRWKENLPIGSIR